MQRIEQRLRHVMGLDGETIGASSLQRVIRLRMKAASCATLEEYDQLLATSAAEWNQLIEAVVITETWFFRDPQAFAALASLMQKDWLPAHPSGRARLLSLPCSSGEEPYSMAMALLDAGIPATRFQIDGVDLSERALERAIAGLYGKNSFRGRDLAFREHHFRAEAEGHFIHQSIRDCVTFQRANLLSEEFTLGRAHYDFIFCRNLLIYFDRATQQRAFRRLESLLAPGGTVFVGPAEVPLAHEHGFASVNLPMAFACRRDSEAAARRRPSATARRVKTFLPPLPRLPVPATVARAITPPPSAEVTFEQARRLADSGKLDEAIRLCEAHLDQHGASVHVYYLLGVIHDAQGNPKARDYYRKALYLDPNHYETLLQMALLAERDGDASAARNLRRRAQRRQLQE
jgi:chemotaxis protein methyltransferase WspC